MQSAAIFVAVLAAASANTIFRSPAHDTAVIKSDRVGGNFAYSVAESPAYGVVSPVVSHVTAPVATTYTVQQPAAATIVSSPVVSEVKSVVPSTVVVPEVKSLHHTLPVATTYANVPAYNYWYNSADTAPIVYKGNDGLEKAIEGTHPTATIVGGTQAVLNTQPVAATYTVQPHHQAVATTYAVNHHHQPTVVAAGAPVATYRTVAGVAPEAHGYVYGAGQPWAVNNWAWNPNWALNNNVAFASNTLVV